MKTQIAAIFAAFITALTATATITVENMGGASLPRYTDGNLSLTGQSWTFASNNRMAQILSRSNATVGSDRSASIRQDSFGDFTGMVTSSAFNSWKAVTETFPPAPSREWGNQHFQGIWIYGDDFVPAEYSVTKQWWIWNESLSLFEALVTSPTPDTTILNTANNFRVRYSVGVDGQPGTSDDVPLASQNMSLPTRSFIYGGIGMSFGAGGAGDNQQKVANTLTYLRGKHPMAELTVTHIPTSTVVKTICVGEFSSIASPVLTATHTDTTVTLNWSDVSNELVYRVQQTDDNGVTWTTIAMRPANTTNFVVPGLVPNSYHGFRVVAVASGAEGVSNVELEQTSIFFGTPTLTIDSQGRSVLRVTGPAQNGDWVKYYLEMSSDLVNWSYAPEGTTVTGSVEAGWTVTVPAMSGGRCFFRFFSEFRG